jgi:caa(3)-type oxidase subunit IV
MADSHSHAPTSHQPTDLHAPPANAHEIEHHIGLYWKVGGILLAFTGITVALAYVDFDKMFGGHGWNMKIGLVVASFKVSLVGAIFMHLKEEKATIWRFLYFTAFFVMGLFLLFWLAFADPIFGTEHWTH